MTLQASLINQAETHLCAGMVPGLWLTEGGQSATGALLDHILESHSAYRGLSERAKEEGEGCSAFPPGLP